jgi:uncharacterized damage-inducible protein DinB
MTPTELIILNFEEIRRRSIILWKAMPEPQLNWQPDATAISSIQMARHVLESEHDFHRIIENRGSAGLSFTSPWKDRPLMSISDEIEFAQPFRREFLDYVQTFSVDDLSRITITRTELGQVKNLGDYLLRVAYHEAVHSGQFLSYLRTLNIARPQIWD